MPFRVIIRRPLPGDCPAFLAAVKASARLHRSLVRPPRTDREYRAYLRRLHPPAHDASLVRLREGGALVGVINVSNIVRGAFRSAYLGYYAFAPWHGRGLMWEGMQLVLRRAFGELDLHRVEANIQPGNVRSIGLVRKCGFVREGFSRRYLKVCGRWRDHERWALLSEEFKPARPGSR